MNMFHNIASCLFAATISSIACAEVIELDAYNPDHCRQQLLNSTDELPIIATYNSEDKHGNSGQFMKKFELLAQEHPERTFFQWDVSEDRLHITQSLCMQQLGFVMQPNIMLLAVMNDFEFMTSPLRVQWAGEMTPEEMNKFIDVDNSDIKNIVSSMHAL